MDIQPFLYPVLATVVAAAALFVLWMLSRFLQAKVGAESYATMMREIRDYVKAAEQKAKAGELTKDARYQFVVGMVMKKFPQLSRAQIDAYVEAAVHVVNAGASLMESIDFDFGPNGEDDEVVAS